MHRTAYRFRWYWMAILHFLPRQRVPLGQLGRIGVPSIFVFDTLTYHPCGAVYWQVHRPRSFLVPLVTFFVFLHFLSLFAGVIVND